MRHIFVVAIVLLVIIPVTAAASSSSIVLQNNAVIDGEYLGVKDGNVCYSTSTYPLILIPGDSIKEIRINSEVVTSAAVSGAYPVDNTKLRYHIVSADSLSVEYQRHAESMKSFDNLRSAIQVGVVPVWLIAACSIILTVKLLNP